MINPSKDIVFYSLRTQYENLGDLIINKTLLDELRNYGKLIVDDQGVPEWFCQNLEITSEERAGKYGLKFNALVLLSGMKTLFQPSTKIYLVTPPGHIYNSTAITWKHALKTSAFAFMLDVFGVRVCRFGASVGPFSSLGQIVEKVQSQFMHFYSVRDTISANYARSIGIQKVEIFPDLAWLMEQKSNREAITSGNNYVVFSFRESSHSLDDSDNYRNCLYRTLDAVVELVCNKWEKNLVISYQVDRDRKICEDIKTRYQNCCNASFIEDKVDSLSLYTLYGRASMVFSNRLHVLMFAMASGSCPIAVIDTAKHNKVTGIFSDAGLNQLILDIEKDSADVEVLNRIIDDPSIKNKISLAFERNRNLANAVLKSVMA